AQNPVRRHLVERAEQHLRGDGRLDVAAKNAGALAVGNRLADEAEVVAQMRGREALHELRRLPELDLKDDREIAIAAQPGEMAARQPAEALARIAQIGDRLAARGQALAHAALEDRDQQVVLALEIE